MTYAWMNMFFMDDADFNQKVAERAAAKKAKSTN